MTSILRSVALAAALFAAAGPALAQVVYKYQRRDGTFVYSDEPIKGARLIERLRLVPKAPAAPQPAAPQAAGPAEQAPDESGPSARAAELDAADAEVRAAEQAVEDAKARLQQGQEPLPGERLANVGGRTSRLTQAYFARVENLEQDLRDANDRLEQAYDRRNRAK
jgi:uncharacterized protein DUF4124